MPGRQVRDAHGGVGDVDVLAAGTARAVGVDAEVLVGDLDLDVLVDLRRHVHRRERRVPALCGIERRDPDQAMHTHLALQVPVGMIADDVERRALQTRLLAVLPVDQLRFPAAALHEAHVHAQEHLGPVLRFRSAGAGMDREPRVLGVVRRRHLHGQLELVRESPGRRERLPGLPFGGLALPQQLAQGVERRPRQDSRRAAVSSLRSKVAHLPLNLLGFFGAGPEVRGRSLLSQAVERAPRGVQIKGSPEALRGAPRRPRGRRRDRRVRSCRGGPCSGRPQTRSAEGPDEGED